MGKRRRKQYSEEDIPAAVAVKNNTPPTENEIEGDILESERRRRGARSSKRGSGAVSTMFRGHSSLG